ncbi:hypothetical protein D3C85_1638960 [compost metagenome]
MRDESRYPETAVFLLQRQWEMVIARYDEVKKIIHRGVGDMLASQRNRLVPLD